MIPIKFTFWLLLGFMVVIFTSGAIGLFIGYNVADTQFQDDKDTQIQELVKRNQQLEAQFVEGLKDLGQQCSK
ncbi:hypothetical protein IAJ44_004278 [Salmonella enterica]|nr:hypothetical protein [Salmonella enterica subsp. enterica serovar Mississippi]EGD6457217.1 hypothetical protein [Salmonella enterica]